MNARLSRQMTLLGICAMGFYGVMLGTGTFSTDLMPQFVISAVIFLSSGRIMKAAARSMARDEDEAAERVQRREPDWPWMTLLLNWSAGLMVIGLMAIFLMKPLGISFAEALHLSPAPEQFFATAVP